MNKRLLEAFETLQAIIHLQSKVIDQLFVLILQYISVEEADKLEILGTIKEAAKLKADLDREGTEI